MSDDTAAKSAALVEEFITARFQFSPHFASQSGLHEFDGRVPDYSMESINSRLDQLRAFLDRLNALDGSKLDPLARYDLALTKYACESEIFSYAEMKSYENLPMLYSMAIGVSQYVKRDYAPLKERVVALIQHLQAIPYVLQVAEANLRRDLARPVLNTAMGMFGGQIIYFNGELTEQVQEVGDHSLIDNFAIARTEAVRALHRFIEQLQAREANAGNEFAIGRERYQHLLKYNEMVEMPLDEVLALGEADLQRNKQRLHEVAQQIDPSRDVREIVAALGKEHATSANLIEETRQTLERIRQFLIDNHVVTVPSEVRALVDETPPFMRWAFAFMSSPGPFEQVADQAYYYITLPDATWPSEKQDEWLTKFDYYTLDDISIHETYPGHYVNFLHMKQAPSKAAKLFRATTFVEGWAHYCEQMMVAELKYGGGNPKLQLAQLLEALVRDVRYVVAIRMHTMGMSVDEATQRFIDDAYMEEATGRAEAVRGTFDPGYFAYTLGKLQILKLREDYKAEQGDKYNLMDFHDRFLSFGSAPIALLRPLVLQHDDGKTL